MSGVESTPPYNPDHVVGELSSGYESVVHELEVGGKRYVVKEPNPALAEKDPRFYVYVKTEEHLKKKKADYGDFKSVFGDIIPEALFVRGNDKVTGEPTNYMFQQKIEGQDLEKTLASLGETERQELVSEIRGQLLEIIWDCKEVMLKYGSLPDLHTGNLIMDVGDSKLYFIDPGLLRDTRDETQRGRLKPILDRVERLEFYEQSLDVTPEERALLDNRPDHLIDSSEYDARISSLKLARETLAKEEESPLEVMDFDPDAEKAFAEKVRAGLDKFIARGGRTVMFDWDGTVRGNYPEIGVKDYIRRGFLESYKYARSLGLRVGVCTLRTSKEIPSLEHLGIKFDDYATLDNMLSYISNYPSANLSAVDALLSRPREEVEQIAKSCFDSVAEGNESEGWEILLQAGGQIQASGDNHPNPKLLFMSTMLEQGERIFLVDDDGGSGQLAEKLGVGANISLPRGYMHDRE